MTNESMKEFALRNDPNVDVIVLKEEGDFGGGFTLSLSGYIKQLEGILVQCETWREEDLIKELNASYWVTKAFFKEEENIDLPEKLNYSLRYVSEEEWMKQLKCK